MSCVLLLREQQDDKAQISAAELLTAKENEAILKGYQEPKEFAKFCWSVLWAEQSFATLALKDYAEEHRYLHNHHYKCPKQRDT